MASKENQEALDSLFFKVCKGNCNYCDKKCESYEEHKTLQQAIDDLELKDKALDKACEIMSKNLIKYQSKEEWKEYLLKEVGKQD